MNKKRFKRINTFKEYCRKERRLNEETNIKVEIDWWDDAIELVMSELREVSDSPIVWETLLDYCRAKWLVLGRETPLFVDELVLAHIRDLIFQNYGPTLFCGEDLSGTSSKNASLGAKILAVAQLSDTILHLVQVESGVLAEVPEESPKTVASVTLGADYDDIFERKNPGVYGFDDFTKALNEAYYHLQFDHFNTVLDKCLRDLESAQKDGVIDYDKVLKSAKKEGKDDKDCMDTYLTNLVRKHMVDEQITIDGVDVRELSKSKVNVLKAARNLFTYHIVQEIYGRMRDEKVK